MNESHIRNDKIEVTIKGIYFAGSYEGFTTFVESLASRPPRNHSNSAQDPYNRGWIFNRHNGNLHRNPHMTVRKGKGVGVPLFSGKLAFEGRNDEDASDFLKELKFHMSFSPLRMFGYRSLRGGGLRNHAWASSEVPTRRPRKGSYLGRNRDSEYYGIGLDNNDNVITRRPWIEHCTRDIWRTFLPEALEAIVRVYRAELERAVNEIDGLSGGILRFDNLSYSIREVESCLEFEVGNDTNSVEVLRRWENPLSWFLRSRIQEYRVNPRFEEDLMSPSFTLQYGSGKSIRVYAKTDKRIRFEYIQKGSEGLGRRERTSTSIAQVAGKILDQAPNAARVLGRLIRSTHRDVIALEEGDPFPHRLILAIARECESLDHADVIISSLVQNGTINPEGVEGIEGSIRRLRDAQILLKQDPATRGQYQAYTVSDRFSAALNHLMQANESNWVHVERIDS